MEDHDLVEHISALVEEEQSLRADSGLDDQARERIRHIEVQLDQLWDLLRRREAREEFGQNPDQEHVRPESVVENYRQ